MNQTEQKLLDCAQHGIWCDFFSGQHSATPMVTIKGGFLREILLTASTPANRIQALRLRGAIIEGVIDLRDGSNLEGGSLPPILLDQCVLNGDITDPSAAAFTARHAHLARLSLTGCRFGRIDISNAVLDGDFVIDGVHPLDETRSCHVCARRVCIRGMVNARNTLLRIPLDQFIPDFNIPDYALDFSGAQIDGTVYLYPGFSAIGGVSFGEAIVKGSIWAIGAKLVGGAGAAFKGQSLNCNGTIALRSEEDKPCIIEGDVDFLGLTAGYIDMSGALIQRPSTAISAQSPPVIFMDMIKVRTVVDLDGINGNEKTLPVGPLDIFMDSAEIGGRLTALEIKLHRFNLQNSRIGGSLTISRVLDADLQGVIDGRNLHVGLDLDLVISNCLVQLRGSYIGSSLSFIGLEDSLSTDVCSVLDASDIEISDNCWLQGVCGEVDLSRAKIGGELLVATGRLRNLNSRGLRVYGSVKIDVIIAAIEKGQGAHFDGGEFNGDFYVEDVSFILQGNTVPEFTIDDAQVKRNFCMKKVSVTRLESGLSGWVKTPPVEVCSGALSFYPGWKLYEARCERFDTQRMAIIAFLYKIDKSEGPILLSGESLPIHELNAKGALKLNRAEQALAYLRFFCNYVWGADGPFEVIVSAGSLDDIEIVHSAAGSTEAPGLPTMVKLSSGMWGCKAMVRHGSSLFHCEFRISSSGMVEMTEDTPVAGIKSSTNVTYSIPLRLVGERNGEWDFWVGRFADRVEMAPDPTAYYNRIRSLERFSSEDGKPVATMSLCGLTAGTLDISALNVGEGILLKMEGFEYRRIETSNQSVSELFSTATGQSAKAEKMDLYNEWLRLQLPGKKTNNNRLLGVLFSPQPHEQLACALRNHGGVKEARHITVSKLELQRKLGVSWASRFAGYLTYVFFGHGLLPGRGVKICLFLLLVGSLSVDFINYGYLRWLPDGLNSWVRLDSPVLVKKTSAENATVSGVSTAVYQTSNSQVEASRCGGEIISVLYAIDVFVPLLNLKEEDKCVITPDSDRTGGYRVLKSLYSILGTLLTSLLILSIPGLLRKRVEQ